jgi:hypothetical protein
LPPISWSTSWSSCFQIHTQYSFGNSVGLSLYISFLLWKNISHWELIRFSCSSPEIQLPHAFYFLIGKKDMISCPEHTVATRDLWFRTSGTLRRLGILIRKHLPI